MFVPRLKECLYGGRDLPPPDKLAYSGSIPSLLAVHTRKLVACTKNLAEPICKVLATLDGKE